MKIDIFKGIAPKIDRPELGFAEIADNVDLSGGKIKTLKNNLLIKEISETYNSLIKYEDSFYYGDDRYFLTWKIGEYNILFYLDNNGKLKKNIGNDDDGVYVGIERPGEPELEEANGNLDGTYYYIITYMRDYNGYTDQSGISESVEIDVESAGIRVIRPHIDDENITHWNIFRMSDATPTYLFVAEVEVKKAYFDDSYADDDLETGLDTAYTSDQGNSIIFDAPPVLSGLIDKPYSGMLFGWHETTLYWSEPGNPDAWPALYQMNFPAEIMGVLSFAGSVAVLTKKGPFRVDGTEPGLLIQNSTLGTEPCISKHVCVCSNGCLYMSDSGLVLFDLYNNKVITDQLFSESYFKELSELSDFIVTENDGKIYIFYSTGCLVYADGNWTTLSVYADAAWKDESEEVYIISNKKIYKLHGGNDALEWCWKSSKIDVNYVGFIEFEGGERNIETSKLSSSIIAQEVEELNILSLDENYVTGSLKIFRYGTNIRYYEGLDYVIRNNEVYAKGNLCTVDTEIQYYYDIYKDKKIPNYVMVNIYIDGVIKKVKKILFDKYRDKRVVLNSEDQGRYVQVEITGTGRTLFSVEIFGE